MPPLVRTKPTAYAAPTEVVPWWEPAVAYVLLVPGVLLSVLGMPIFLGQWSCGDSRDANCPGGGEALVSTTGSEGGIVAAAAGCYLLVLVAAVVVQLTVGKLHFAIVWSIASLAPVFAVVAYGIITGAIGTPWGQLVEALPPG